MSFHDYNWLNETSPLTTISFLILSYYIDMRIVEIIKFHQKSKYAIIGFKNDRILKSFRCKFRASF